jgi:hypothetical protein
MSRRAHTSPFEWPLFFRNFPFHPVPVWVACTFLVKPLSRATPWLLRASCAGAARQGVANVALIVYANVLPAAAATAVYLLAGRRRMTHPQHRAIGDGGLVLVLLVSAISAAMMARLIGSAWPMLRPGLAGLRAACWP